MRLPCDGIHGLTPQFLPTVLIYNFVNVTTFLDAGDLLGAGGVANSEVNALFPHSKRRKLNLNVFFFAFLDMK